MKILHLSILSMMLLLLPACGEDEETTTPNPVVESVTTTEDLINLFTGEVAGTSELVRVQDIIQVTVVANDLIPGHIYNLVCAVFNKPENCEGKCSPEDFQDSNPEVEAVAFILDGKGASSTTETFSATLAERDITSYEMNQTYVSLYGDHGGLQDAQKATIGLLIRSQGPAQTGPDRTNQLTTFSNACFFNSWDILDPNSRIPVEPGECALIYDSQHVAPD